jgi:hypothetical protein
MGAKREKLSVQRFKFAIATRETQQKASIDAGCTSLPDSEDWKVMSTAKNEYTMDDSSY